MPINVCFVIAGSALVILFLYRDRLWITSAIIGTPMVGLAFLTRGDLLYAARTFVIHPVLLIYLILILTFIMLI